MNACCWVLQLDHLMGTFSCMLLKFEMKLKLFTKWCTFFHINTIDGVYSVSLLCFIVYDMNCGCSDTAVWLSLLEFLNLFLQYSFEYLFIQLWQHIYFDFVTECEYWQTHNRKTPIFFCFIIICVCMGLIAWFVLFFGIHCINVRLRMVSNGRK